MWQAFAGRYRSRAEMLDDLTYEEYQEHEELYRQSPYGPYVDGLSQARTSQAVYVTAVGDKAPEVDDLLIRWVSEADEIEEAKAIRNAIETANERMGINAESILAADIERMEGVKNGQ